MFRFNKPSSASLLWFAKVIIIKIVKNVVMNQFGHVVVYLSRLYWCVYSTLCTVLCTHINKVLRYSLDKYAAT